MQWACQISPPCCSCKALLPQAFFLCFWSSPGASQVTGCYSQVWNLPSPLHQDIPASLGGADRTWEKDQPLSSGSRLAQFLLTWFFFSFFIALARECWWCLTPPPPNMSGHHLSVAQWLNCWDQGKILVCCRFSRNSEGWKGWERHFALLVRSKLAPSPVISKEQSQIK